MRLLEHQAKVMLAAAGIATPSGAVIASDAEVGALSLTGRVAVKAQVPVGGRGKAGGVRLVEGADDVRQAVADVLALTIDDHRVTAVLVEHALEVARELYVAVAIDTSTGVPVVLASSSGGVDIEDDPSTIVRVPFHPGAGIDEAGLDTAARALHAGAAEGAARELIATLVARFGAWDALLVEINPLVITTDGQLIAADAKIELDDAAAGRHDRPDSHHEDGTDHERRAAALGLRLIELGGDVAILANGAGLTMATMDAVTLAGGRPANFLEIGGDAYTKATPALEIVLDLPGVRSLLVNFCGAFARCDVMAAGVVEAWHALQPDIPVFFSIHGTGQDEARQLVRQQLGVEPFDRMDDAVAAAVAAAR